MTLILETEILLLGVTVKNIKNFAKRLWQEESAQGATEYILLLVVVVALVMIFKNQITETLSNKVGELSDSITNFSGN